MVKIIHNCLRESPAVFVTCIFTLFIEFLFLREFLFRKVMLLKTYQNIFWTFSCFLFYYDDQHSPWECSGGQREFWMCRNLALVIIKMLFLYSEKKLFIYLLFTTFQISFYVLKRIKCLKRKCWEMYQHFRVISCLQ